MVGLVEKPHFDARVFKPGTPIFVREARQPFQKCNIFAEHCLVICVDKDRMKVAYIQVDKSESEEGRTLSRVILAQDVADGNVIINFMKPIFEEEGK